MLSTFRSFLVVYTGIAYVPGLSKEVSSQIKYFVPEVKIALRPPQKLRQFYSK